ncbi:hypothetical protein B0T16DRAFT_417722 [Cercophora newfieldiana]|uniref:Uncharacterized protein n=1 Tax=Cercophora newfieldiana TaxID=92897 RepID=A0AA39Y1W0_9PEZI|nr:hypothetical protein B0T16DRAFT_417722 [Cercophora newfieldiana]
MQVPSRFPPTNSHHPLEYFAKVSVPSPPRQASRQASKVPTLQPTNPPTEPISTVKPCSKARQGIRPSNSASQPGQVPARGRGGGLAAAAA